MAYHISLKHIFKACITCWRLIKIGRIVDICLTFKTFKADFIKLMETESFKLCNFGASRGVNRASGDELQSERSSFGVQMNFNDFS